MRCPECTDDPGFYYGISNVSCANIDCENYSAPVEKCYLKIDTSGPAVRKLLLDVEKRLFTRTTIQEAYGWDGLDKLLRAKDDV